MTMTSNEVLARLGRAGNRNTIAEMKQRYGIPNDRAFGVPMGDMKRLAKEIGTDHRLAKELWKTGWYEARTVAVFISDPGKLTGAQMNRWADQFDSWAICDTACFHLFDRSAAAWQKVEEWHSSNKEFVKRAAFALLWGLSVHDKAASDARFRRALTLIGKLDADDRPLVMKAIDMSLRATGKRNRKLNDAAIRTATILSRSKEKSLAWIGRHSLSELNSAKVQARLE